MKKYHGQVIYIYAFDIAYELKTQPPDRVLGIPATDYMMLDQAESAAQVSIDPSRSFCRRICQLAGGPAEISTRVLVFGVGAISIQYRVPFEIDHLDQLITYHDLQVDSQPMELRAVELARRIQADLHDHCIRPTPTLDPEPYTLFCIDELPVSPDRKGMTAEQWLREHVRPVAGLLTEEPEIENLSVAGSRGIHQPISQLLQHTIWP